MPIFRKANHSREKWKDRPKGLELGRGGSDQDLPQEKEKQKGKMVVWGGPTNNWEKKRS